MMTLTEKRQVRAAALLEYEKARQQLESLRSRACAISDDLSEVACWLNDTRDIPHNPAISRKRLRDDKIERNLARYRASLNFDAIFTLREEIQRLKTTLDDLAQQNKELWV